MRVKKKDMDALQDVADKWKNSVHQDNFSRTAILIAFDEGHTCTEVIRHIRLEVYNSTKKPWYDVVLGDSRWTKIERSIERIWKAHKNKRLDHLRGTGGSNFTQEDYDAMASKSINPNARGRKITHKKKEVSKILKRDYNIYNASHHLMHHYCKHHTHVSRWRK